MAEAFYENLAGLGASYGYVSPIHPLQLLDAAGARLEGVPGVVSWASQRLLTPFSRLLGFRASYLQYASAGFTGSADE
jgi:hypothetical protein